jgi:hypothetical protein
VEQDQLITLIAGRPDYLVSIVTKKESYIVSTFSFQFDWIIFEENKKYKYPYTNFHTLSTVNDVFIYLLDTFPSSLMF